jgi:MoaD family protein
MLREITCKKEETIIFPKSEPVTIKLVLTKLSKEYGKSYNEYVYDLKTGEVRGFLQFLVNGRSVSPTKGIDTKLRDGDVLAIVPPVGGG